MYRITTNHVLEPKAILAVHADIGTLGYINDTKDIGLRTYNGLVSLSDPKCTWTDLHGSGYGPRITPLPKGTIITIEVL